MKTLRNDLSASKINVFFTVTAGLFIVSTVAASFPQYIPQQTIMISLACIFGLATLFIFLANHHYVWMFVEQQKLKIRFYSVHSFLRKHQAIEIPIEAFKGYEIKKSLGGLRKQLILKQRVKNKIATYPPVSIATFSTKEYNAMIAILNGLSQ